MQLEPGVVVAEHYRLEELVGRGGMGAVWRATDLRLGRLVALKVLHTDLRDDPSLRERFQREARLLASIDHPAIVPIFHLGVIEDGDKQCPCIVMPFVKGRTLAEAIKKGRFTLEQAIPLVKSLLDALSVAHAVGVVHRDLKPQNVVLEDRNGAAVVRLLDFGIAKDVAAQPTAGSVLATRAGMLLGTPEYMSPEQVRDPSTVDGRADLWAVGVTLFEMLTGELPFTAGSQVEIIAKVMMGQHRRPSELVPTMPAPVDAFFNKVFDRNIDGRFRTALQMSEALDPLAAGPLKTVPFAWDGGTIDPSKKNPGVFSPSAAPPGLVSIPSMPAASAVPVTTSNTYESPAVKSIPVIADATRQPEYFGAVTFGGAQPTGSAIVPAGAPQLPAVVTGPSALAAASGAASTQSGRTLTILALLVPITLALACAMTVFAATRC